MFASSAMELDASSQINTREPLVLKDFERFKLSTKTFEKQFWNIYAARLAALKSDVKQKAQAKWGREVAQTLELDERSPDEPCIVIGILYKHQELKPSIVRELSEELQVVPQPSRSNYASSKDTLFLEDETLRIKLTNTSMCKQDLVTGLICGVLGHVLETGEFRVMDWCFPGCCPKSITTKEPSISRGKILLISGLDLENTAQCLSLNLLSEWISGMIGCKDSQKEVASIVCVIIAGNSISSSMKKHNYKSYSEIKSCTESWFKEAAKLTHRLDGFLYPILQCCPVILMPGEFDPSCHTIPQQPFHPCILPQSSRSERLHVTTNPWIGSLNSRIVAGSSGQPILDIMKVAGFAELSPLTWLERTLNWRHFAPTAPDTLSAYPYFESDPFIMTKCPDVYFVGNMESYDTKCVTVEEGQAIRLICIPKFSKTQSGVLVDLEDLKARPVSFGVS